MYTCICSLNVTGEVSGGFSGFLESRKNIQGYKQQLCVWQWDFVRDQISAPRNKGEQMTDLKRHRKHQMRGRCRETNLKPLLCCHKNKKERWVKTVLTSKPLERGAVPWCVNCKDCFYPNLSVSCVDAELFMTDCLVALVCHYNPQRSAAFVRGPSIQPHEYPCCCLTCYLVISDIWGLRKTNVALCWTISSAL